MIERQKILIQEYRKNPLLSASELAKITGYNRNTILSDFRKLGILRDRKLLQRNNNNKRSKVFFINNELEQLILGSILGDGSISKWSRNKDSKLNLNSKVTIKHSLIQEEYCLYKQALFSNHIKTYLYYKQPSSKDYYIQDKKVKDNGSIILDTMKNISINKFRDIFYNKNNIKFISKYLYKLSSLGLAIWFMDDGSKHSSGYYLHTNCFTYKDHLLLVKILKHNFDLNSSIHKSKDSFTIYIPSKEVAKFNSLVKDYICESMKYKIHWQ